MKGKNKCNNKGLAGVGAVEAVKHSVIQHLLITGGTNVQADTSTTCIRPELSGAAHVLFGGLLIGPNKDPQGGFAYERQGTCAWLEPSLKRATGPF